MFRIRSITLAHRNRVKFCMASGIYLTLLLRNLVNNNDPLGIVSMEDTLQRETL